MGLYIFSKCTNRGETYSKIRQGETQNKLWVNIVVIKKGHTVGRVVRFESRCIHCWMSSSGAFMTGTFQSVSQVQTSAGDAFSNMFASSGTEAAVF